MASRSPQLGRWAVARARRYAHEHFVRYRPPARDLRNGCVRPPRLRSGRKREGSLSRDSSSTPEGFRADASPNLGAGPEVQRGRSRRARSTWIPSRQRRRVLAAPNRSRQAGTTARHRSLRAIAQPRNVDISRPHRRIPRSRPAWPKEQSCLEAVADHDRFRIQRFRRVRNQQLVACLTE
jgi:hypothetical protein